MMYVRFPLSLRKVEDLLHERGSEISHEAVRLLWIRFGRMFAAEIRKKRFQQMHALFNWRWHLDEFFVKTNSEMHYLWRAVDFEGEVLEPHVMKPRDRKAVLKFLNKLKNFYSQPHVVVTEKSRSYGAAIKAVGNALKQGTGRWLNNYGDNSHQSFRRRERAMLGFC